MLRGSGTLAGVQTNKHVRRSSRQRSSPRPHRKVRSLPAQMLPIFGLPAPLQVMTTVLRFIRGRRCRTIGDGEVFGVAYLLAQPVYLHPLMGTTAGRVIWTARITARTMSEPGGPAAQTGLGR